MKIVMVIEIFFSIGILDTHPRFLIKLHVIIELLRHYEQIYEQFTCSSFPDKFYN